MLSTHAYAAARPGGCLICLWTQSYAIAIAARRSLIPLLGSIACGVETWDGRGNALVLVWCPERLAEAVIAALDPFGDVIDWPGKLPIAGEWVTFYGAPHLLAAEDVTTEGPADLPDWLARMQEAT
jgi:hypothetical protein